MHKKHITHIAIGSYVTMQLMKIAKVHIHLTLTADPHVCHL